MSEILIVTGMSGAGKSQAANALEDLGYYCVDNIPPSIIPVFINFAGHNDGEMGRLAIITDVRGGEMFETIIGVLDQMKEEKTPYRILFLDSADDVLVRRYKENRRRHPLCDDGVSLSEAVEKERKMLSELRFRADFLVDTSHLSVAQLKERLSSLFFGNVNQGFRVQCMSFGFKYGPATEADLVIDVRCLPNPFYVPQLRPKTGLDQEVRDYVLSESESRTYKDKLFDFIDYSLPLYCKEGKSQLIIAIGCTGGKHRSVTFAELIASHLREAGYICTATHRDILK